MSITHFNIICCADDAVLISDLEDTLLRFLHAFKTTAQKKNNNKHQKVKIYDCHK